jgi:dTDP-4-dehydrorhamnose reductase
VTRPTILLTGATGQIGYELARLLPRHGEVAALDRSRLDLKDVDALRATVRALRPQLIVNAAAYTAVDQAERESALAEAINARAPGVLAEEAKRLGAVLIHYSTDYVFDGLAGTPYAEDAPASPLNAYGRSKLHGEQAIAASAAAAVVLRTSWVYASRGRNFFVTIRKLAAERDELRIVADQWGVPNWSRALAEATSTLVGGGVPALASRAGLYHLSGQGQTNWFEFARAIVGDVDRPKVIPITTAEYPTAARRPPYAVLATMKFERGFGFGLPDWREMLRDCVGDAGGNH